MSEKKVDTSIKALAISAKLIEISHELLKTDVALRQALTCQREVLTKLYELSNLTIYGEPPEVE